MADDRPSSAEAAWPFWYVRALGPDGMLRWAALLQSEEHPDGTLLELPEAEAELALQDQPLVGRAHVGPDGTLTRVEVSAEAAPKAPPLWFLELDEPEATPPATTLLAFSGHDVDPGTFLDRTGLQGVAVTSDDQLGAYRWVPHSGFVDQLYVTPQWRRRSIGTALIAAASLVVIARGWPRMWSDGQRTAEGDRMRSAARWSHRTDDLTHLMPPMTPPEER